MLGEVSNHVVDVLESQYRIVLLLFNQIFQAAYTVLECFVVCIETFLLPVRKVLIWCM